MIICGIEHLDYVSKKTNQRVLGTKIYVQEPKEGVEGYVTDNHWLRADKFSDIIPLLSIGCIIDLYYDKYQNIEKVIIQ